MPILASASSTSAPAKSPPARARLHASTPRVRPYGGTTWKDPAMMPVTVMGRSNSMVCAVPRKPPPGDGNRPLEHWDSLLGTVHGWIHLVLANSAGGRELRQRHRAPVRRACRRGVGGQTGPNTALVIGTHRPPVGSTWQSPELRQRQSLMEALVALARRSTTARVLVLRTAFSVLSWAAQWAGMQPCGGSTWQSLHILPSGVTLISRIAACPSNLGLREAGGRKRSQGTDCIGMVNVVQTGLPDPFQPGAEPASSSQGAVHHSLRGDGGLL